MRTELEEAYVPGCYAYQRNKRPAGPLHLLPVTDGRRDSVAIDFIGRREF